MLYRAERAGTAADPGCGQRAADAVSSPGEVIVKLAVAMVDTLRSGQQSDLKQVSEGAATWAKTVDVTGLSGPISDVAAAKAAITELLADTGFAPVPVRDPATIEVAACPYNRADDHCQKLLCSIHLGLLRGELERRDAPVTITFSEIDPGQRCVAHFVGREAPETSVQFAPIPGASQPEPASPSSGPTGSDLP